MIYPAFSMRLTRAANSGKMSAVFDNALSICRGIGGAGFYPLAIALCCCCAGALVCRSKKHVCV